MLGHVKLETACHHRGLPTLLDVAKAASSICLSCDPDTAQEMGLRTSNHRNRRPSCEGWRYCTLWYAVEEHHELVLVFISHHAARASHERYEASKSRTRSCGPVFSHYRPILNHYTRSVEVSWEGTKAAGAQHSRAVVGSESSSRTRSRSSRPGKWRC